MSDQKSERIPKHPEGPLDTKGRSVAEAAMPDRSPVASLAVPAKGSEDKARPLEEKYSSLTLGIIHDRLLVLYRGFENHSLIHYLAENDEEKAVIITPGVEPEEVQGLPAMVDFVVLMPGVDPRIVNFLPPSVKCIYLQAQEKYFSYEKRKVIASLPCQTFVITHKTTLEDIRYLPDSISRICITKGAAPTVIAALPRKPYELSMVVGADYRRLTADLLASAKSLSLIGYSPPDFLEVRRYFNALEKERPGFLREQDVCDRAIIDKPNLPAIQMGKREQEAQDWPPSDEDDYLYHHFGVLFKLSPVSPDWLLSQFASQPIAALKSKIINAASHPQRGSRGFWLFMKAAVEKEQCGSIDKQRETLVTLFPTLKLAMKFLKDFQEKYPTCKTPIFSACSFDLPDEHQRGTWHIWQELAVKYMLEPGFKELLPYVGKVQEILLRWGIPLTNNTPLEALLAAAACLGAPYNLQSKEGERLQKMALLAVNKPVRDEKQEAPSAAHIQFFYQEAENAFQLGNFRKAYFLFLMVVHGKKVPNDLRMFAQIRLFEMYARNNCWVKQNGELASIVYRPKIDELLPELEKTESKSGKFLYLKAVYDFYNRASMEKELLSIQQAADANYIPAKIYLAKCYESGSFIDKDMRKAMEIYQELAEKPEENATAQYYVGNAFLREEPPDIKQACIYFEKAAKQGDVLAQRDLGWCYYHLSLDKEGIGSTPQEKLQQQQKALRWLKRAADQADPWALYLLAQFYGDDRNGPVKDSKMADSFYKQAAAQNHALSLLHRVAVWQEANVEENQQAMFSLCQQIGSHNPAALYFLGRAYFDGAGVWKNPEKAFSYFEEALAVFQSGQTIIRYVQQITYKKQMELIFPNLLLYLAKCYEQGLGTGQDKVKAVEFYQKAADLGNPEACVYLGRLKLEEGEIEGDRGAHFWHDRAIRSGRADVLCTVAETYRLAAESKKADEKTANSMHGRAVKLYGQASKQGDPKAKLALAEHYYRLGKGGFKQDLPVARALCKAAAEKGDLDAMYTYGEYWRTGIGGEASVAEAISWLQRAVDGGHVAALVALALIISLTDPKKHTVAHHYLKKAVAKGSVRAQSILGMFHRDGICGVEKDAKKALSFFQKAVEYGDVEGEYQLAHYYRLGDYRLGVPPDERKALALYQKVAASNHPMACGRMALFYKDGWPAAGVQKDTLEAIQWLEKFLFAQVNCHLDSIHGLSFLEKISYHLTKQWKNLTAASTIQTIFEALPHDLRSPDLDLVNYRQRYAAFVLHPHPQQLANALTKLYKHIEKSRGAAEGLPRSYLQLERILWQLDEPEKLANLLCSTPPHLLPTTWDNSAHLEARTLQILAYFKWEDAIKRNDIEKARQLLEDLRVDPNIQDENGETPLCQAFKAKNFAMAEMLIKSKRVNIDSIDRDSNGALFYAIGTKNLPLVNAVFERGAQVEISRKAGVPLLQHACSIDDEAVGIRSQILCLLIANGADVFDFLYSGLMSTKDMERLWKADSKIVHRRSEEGLTLLHIAALQKFAPLVRLLLKYVDSKADAIQAPIQAPGKFNLTVASFLRDDWPEGIVICDEIAQEAKKSHRSQAASPPSQQAQRILRQDEGKSVKSKRKEESSDPSLHKKRRVEGNPPDLPPEAPSAPAEMPAPVSLVAPPPPSSAHDGQSLVRSESMFFKSNRGQSQSQPPSSQEVRDQSLKEGGFESGM